jgi:beta-glucosidase
MYSWKQIMAVPLIAATVSACSFGTDVRATNDTAFDRSFYWGVATAGFQVEGDAPDSNWRRLVDDPTGKASILGGAHLDPYGDADDFRHRYREDIDRAKAMGVNTFRFGIEWSRVMPQPGVWDQRELAYYDDIMAALRERHMTPMITLLHFVYPGWVVDRGGLMNNLGAFTEFVTGITKRYARQGVLWVTINEPLLFAYLETAMKDVPRAQLGTFVDWLAQAHRAAYRAAHDADPDAKVTTNEAYLSRDTVAAFPNADPVLSTSFFDKVTDSLDYLGFDYYTGTADDNPASAEKMDARWDIKLQPEDVYYVARDYARRFPGLPIYVVENGMVTDDAKPRADGVTRAQHLEDTVFWLQRAKADGIPIIGYNYWSLLDNYEWGSYRPRFGLFTVDVRNDPTLTRTPTDAVAAYTRLIRDGGTASGYRPVLPAARCSRTVGESSCTPLDPHGAVATLK